MKTFDLISEKWGMSRLWGITMKLRADTTIILGAYSMADLTGLYLHEVTGELKSWRVRRGAIPGRVMFYSRIQAQRFLDEWLMPRALAAKIAGKSNGIQ